MWTPIIGWASSVVLVLTVSRQVWGQWRKGTSDGVSLWLYVGQIVASSGFLVYSALIGDPVFFVTQLALLAAAAVGLGLYRRHRLR